MLLKLGEQFGMSAVAGQGAPYGNNGLWLKGPVQLMCCLINETCPDAIRAAHCREATLRQHRRDLLAEHREYCKSIKGN